jgi:hypothetical protein
MLCQFTIISPIFPPVPMASAQEITAEADAPEVKESSKAAEAALVAALTRRMELKV